MSETEDLFSQIINSDSKQICLISAPGSGKTSRALIPKMEKVLSHSDIDSKNVVILTFSRMSAADLKKRIGETGARASTVHSFCLSLLLSEDNHQIRTRINSIIFEFERDTLIADLKATFTNIHRKILDKQLQEFAAGWAIEPHDQVFERNDEQRAFKQAVVNWLDEHHAAMMEEIVYHAVDLTDKVSDLKLLDESKYIFVDEYQDLNVLEQKFVDQLAAQAELLLVVGDPDQSIYSFKYAHPEGIKSFSGRFNVESYSHLKTGRCAKSIVRVARELLKQSEPTRTELLEALPRNEEGEVHFVRKQTQDEEFAHVLKQISSKLNAKVPPNEIIVLVPRKKLGQEFADYAEKNKESVGISQADASFNLISKVKFTIAEQRRVLLLALLSNPSSILHFRCYVGIGDKTACAEEIRNLKNHYGGLENAIANAKIDDFPKKKSRLRTICKKIADLRQFLESHKGVEITDALLDELFPATDASLVQLRSIIDKLREDDDTTTSLYNKFADHFRNIPRDEKTVRIMTMMASKGLEADHVFILGCNSGNIPGNNRSTFLSEMQHKEEQRRLLYVAFTRAKKTLTVSWARRMSFSGSKGQATASVGTRNIGGEKYSILSISPFLQDLPGIKWET